MNCPRCGARLWPAEDSDLKCIKCGHREYRVVALAPIPLVSDKADNARRREKARAWGIEWRIEMAGERQKWRNRKARDRARRPA